MNSHSTICNTDALANDNDIILWLLQVQIIAYVWSHVFWQLWNKSWDESSSNSLGQQFYNLQQGVLLIFKC